MDAKKVLFLAILFILFVSFVGHSQVKQEFSYNNYFTSKGIIFEFYDSILSLGKIRNNILSQNVLPVAVEDNFDKVFFSPKYLEEKLRNYPLARFPESRMIAGTSNLSSFTKSVQSYLKLSDKIRHSTWLLSNFKFSNDLVLKTINTQMQFSNRFGSNVLLNSPYSPIYQVYQNNFNFYSHYYEKQFQYNRFVTDWQMRSADLAFEAQRAIQNIYEQQMRLSQDLLIFGLSSSYGGLAYDAAFGLLSSKPAWPVLGISAAVTGGILDPFMHESSLKTVQWSSNMQFSYSFLETQYNYSLNAQWNTHFNMRINNWNILDLRWPQFNQLRTIQWNRRINGF